jgi:pimeloyl-ACP methyl ester carboxylesterase
VEHGFRPTERGTVTLKCEPEFESRTFENGSTNGVFGRLGALRCPVLILGGVTTDEGPASMVERVADAISGAEQRRYNQLSHFGPMEDPNLIADAAATFFALHC